MGKKTVVENTEDVKSSLVRELAPERVGVSIGVTRNLGDYNSLTIRLNNEDNVGEDEDFDTAIDRVFSRVESKLEAKLDEYTIEP